MGVRFGVVFLSEERLAQAEMGAGNLVMMIGGVLQKIIQNLAEEGLGLIVVAPGQHEPAPVTGGKSHRALVVVLSPQGE